MSKLHVDSVMKSYDGRPILTDIFIGCETGEVVGLLGRNGCGKSTLLKIIFGSLSPDNRFVRIDQKQIHGLSDGHRYINYLPQDGFLPNHIKVRTIIKSFCDNQNSVLVAGHHLIKPCLDKKSGDMSGGEKRFLEVLLMIYSRAEFVLIDEPFNGISPLYVDEIKRHIKSQSTNKGFIVTDHSYENILEIATRVVLIHDGAMRNILHKEDLRHWGYIR